MEILFSHYSIIDKAGFGRSFMLARELVALGNKVTFLTSQSPNNFKFPYKKEIRDGVEIYAFPDFVPSFMLRTGFGFLSTFCKIIFVLHNHYDIYHADAGHRLNGGFPIYFKKLFNKITYVTEWWDFFGKGGKFDKRKGIKKYSIGFYDLIFEKADKKLADGIVCLSSGMKERALDLGIPSDRICVINGGSDINRIKFYHTTELRSEFNLNIEVLTFGFVGMDRDEFYDILPFIKAVNHLKDERINVNWFTTGNKLSYELKKKFNIGTELTEFGWLEYSQFSKLLSCADVFLLLQREDLENYTRWPNKIGDYLAAGRPILTNPFGDVSKLVIEYPDAFYPVENKCESIVEMIKTIKYSNYFRQRYGIRKYAKLECSWKIKGEKLLNFYYEKRQVETNK